MREARTMNMSQPVNGYGIIALNAGAYFERSVAADNLTTVPTPFTRGRFLHFVGTYDGTKLAFSIDAVPVSTVADVRVMPAHTAMTYVGGLPPSYGYAPGAIDEVAIYDHVLAADRIALHHDIGVNGPR